MKKFEILDYKIGEEGVYLKLKPDVETFEAIDLFMQELFPKFAFKRFRLSGKSWKDFEGKKHLDDGQVLFQISFVAAPFFSAEFFDSSTPESLKIQYRRAMEIGAHVNIDYWSDVERLKSILPKYCSNPEAALEATKNPKIKYMTKRFINVDLKAFFLDLSHYLQKKNILEAEVSYFDLEIDDSRYFKEKVEKLGEKIASILEEYHSICIEIPELHMSIYFEDELMIDFKSENSNAFEFTFPAGMEEESELASLLKYCGE